MMTKANDLAALPNNTLAFRNRIINGAMAVDQRNGGAAVSTGGGVIYCVDRWYTGSNGAATTIQRVQGATANQFRLQVTGAAGVTSVSIAQRIEALNSADLAGKTVTLSFDAANTLLTTMTWSASYANSYDNFAAATSITSGSVAVSSTVTRFSVTFAVPAAAVNGLLIAFSLGAQTSGTILLGDVQLELGPVATLFERRPYPVELALCQRYFAASAFTEYHFNGAPGATYVSTYRINMPVQMRANPSISVNYSASNAIAAYGWYTNNLNFSVHYISASTSTNAYMYFTWTTNAEL
jgi:hypothetical protein